MDIHTTLEGDRYVHCAYCSIRIEVGSLDTGTVQCMLCRRPTFVNTNHQMGQPSSSIQPSSSEAPFFKKPTTSDFHQFCEEEKEHIKDVDPEKTPKQALDEARKNWATKGEDWLRKKQGK